MTPAKWSSRRLRHLEIALAALLVMCIGARAATAVEWDTYTPITAISVSNPGANEVWLGGMFNTLTCSASTDTDRWRESASQPWNNADDSVTHYWTGGGLFRNNNSVGTSVDYNSPWIDGTDTITCYANDDYAPVVNNFLADDPLVSVVRNVRTVLLEVHKVGFDGVYPLYRTPATLGGWDSGTVAIPPQEIYNADDTAAEKAAKNHVCTLRGATNLVAKIKCRTPAALTKTASFHLGGVVTNAGGILNWGACSIAAGQSESNLCSCPSTGAMYGKVHLGSWAITWKYINTNFENVQRDLNSTSHNYYLTYGAPDPGGAELTVQRIAFLCNSCLDADTDRKVADGIWNALGNNLPFGIDPMKGQTTLSDDWPNKSGAPYCGYCDHHARFMVRCLKLIGSTGTWYNTYASTDATVDSPESVVFMGNTWFLKFSFAANGVVDNNFEGSVDAGGRYYAVSPKLVASTKVNLLRQVGPDSLGAQQLWVRTADNTFGGATIQTGPTPVPYPPAN